MKIGAQIIMGVVENRNDPLKLGRCQVRIMGLHTADKTILPTSELPWALVMQPATSAAMNGIGQAPVGLVPGTWVVVLFQDEEQQQPVIIGSIGGIPDVNTISYDPITDVIVMRDETTGIASQTTATTNVRGDVIESTGSPISEPPKAQVYSGGGKTNTQLPVGSPPQSYVGNRGLASSGIQAIIVACQTAGYTDKNAMSAILGIVGGECGWIMQTEQFGYADPNRLVKLFSAFNGDVELAKQYAIGGPKRADLPEFVYGYQSKKGATLGNTDEGDGAKYIGRGFIQLTGKSNYKRFSDLTGLDLIGNPEQLNTNIDASAKVAVAFIKENLKRSSIAQNDPAFFLAAAKAVNSTHLIEPKQRYYEYFLGQTLSSGENKLATAEDVTNVDSSAANGSLSLPGGDRTINSVIGFSDPQGKYPLRDYLHEPDTNRLARGVSKGTIADKKSKQRTTSVPRPFEGSFDQPPTPFGAVYPYNKVFESESGHVMEFDDTPTQERVSIIHRTGTFTEIDANGTQTNKIVGDNFTIMERNGCIFVRGEANITVDGNINILCNTTTNIEVMGNANIDVRTDAHIGVNRDVIMGVGRNVHALIKGNMTTRVDGNYTLDIGGNMSTKVTGDYMLDVAGNMSTKVSKDKITGVSGNTSSKTAGTFNACISGAAQLSSSTKMSITSTGNTAIEGSLLYLNTAGQATVATCAIAESATSVNDSITGIHIPLVGNVKSPEFRYLETPPQGISQDIEYGETPDEIDSRSAAAMKNEISGTPSTPNNTPAVDIITPGKNQASMIDASCDLIMSTDAFQDSYVLSERSHITIGTLLECPGNCSTPQDTVVTDSKDANSKQYRITKQEVVCNMKQVAINILEKVYDAAGGKNAIVVTSSFRTPGVAATSNRSSDHNKGRAIDIQLRGRYFDHQAHFDLANALAKVLPYDQLILEYRDQRAGVIGPRKVWIHISYRGNKNRNMAFTMLNDSVYQRDINNIPNGFVLL